MTGIVITAPEIAAQLGKLFQCLALLLPICFESGNALVCFSLLLLQLVKLHDDDIILGARCGLGLPVELDGVFTLEFSNQNLDGLLRILVLAGGKIVLLIQQFMIPLFVGLNFVIDVLQLCFRFFQCGLKSADTVFFSRLSFQRLQ